MKTFANWAQIVRGEKVHLDNIAFNYLVLTSKKKEGFLRGKNEKNEILMPNQPPRSDHWSEKDQTILCGYLRTHTTYL